MKSTRTVAMYLPQFHEIPENNKWWGEGYTEWTAVKQAAPAFPGHEQPIVPLHEHYYDLLSKDTMVWQAHLAKTYGVDGFCFYHYWFGKNRKILERPAENLLRWKDIDLQFCFCWDPSTWARTWTKLGNSWADAFESSKKRDMLDDGVLLRQDFGDEEYWKTHFDYLLPFFRDERYLRVDGKPVFLFYSSSFPCLGRMAADWRRRAEEAGLPGLYLVGYCVPNPSLDAVIFPMAFGKDSFVYDKKAERLIPGTSMFGYDYDEVWQNFLQSPPCSTQRTLWLGTVSYDDSPRRGANGRIYLHASPEKFCHYFGQLMRKSRMEGNPFIFIDAWNEWGEGKKLEPDTRTGFRYLEAVRSVVQTETERLPPIDASSVEDGRVQYMANLESMVLRFKKFYAMFRDWKICDQAGQSLGTYFVSRKFHRIAIYGFGIHGRMFYQEMQSAEDVDVAYLIDARKGGMEGKTDVPVFSPLESLPLVDAIVVSVVDEYATISAMLRKKIDAPIISLAEVVADVAGKQR